MFLLKVDEKVEYRVFKKHMYGGPKGLGDPNYRHGTFWIPISTFPLQRNVQNGGGPNDTAGRVGRFNPLSIHLPDFHQRMRDITRTQLCTKEVKIVNTEPVPHSARNSCQLLPKILRVPQISIASPQVAEFSECSKTHGFSFVLHCRQLKDDMVCLVSLTHQIYA